MAEQAFSVHFHRPSLFRKATCTCFAVFACFTGNVWAADYYPDVRKVLLQAEAESTGIPLLPERNAKLERVADLLSRAGYLDDAARIAARLPLNSYALVSVGLAQAFQGELETGLRTINKAQLAPEKKSAVLVRLAHMLWRLKRMDEERRVLDLAAAAASRDPSKRSLQLRMIAQLRENLNEDPPLPLSMEPSPPPKPAISPFDPFPISVAGFRDPDPDQATRRQTENAPYLERIYKLVESGDIKGAFDYAQTGSSSFQKTLGLATIQHLAVQAKVYDAAERTVGAMPDDTDDSKLAKAEAFASLAVAYATHDQDALAAKCFTAAREQTAAVSNELSFGRVAVMAEIAGKQAEAGYSASAQETFRDALKLVAFVPQNKERLKGIYGAKRRFRNDAFGELMNAQIRSKDLGGAKETAQRWFTMEGTIDKNSITGIWISFGLTDDAIGFAKSLPRVIDRVEAYVSIASDLLNELGAPSY